MHVMGKDVTEKLEYVPATIKVIEDHRLKYACRACEKMAPRPRLNKRRQWRAFYLKVMRPQA
jgi:transposase